MLSVILEGLRKPDSASVGLLVLPGVCLALQNEQVNTELTNVMDKGCRVSKLTQYFHSPLDDFELVLHVCTQCCTSREQKRELLMGNGFNFQVITAPVSQVRCSICVGKLTRSPAHPLSRSPIHSFITHTLTLHDSHDSPQNLCQNFSSAYLSKQQSCLCLCAQSKRTMRSLTDDHVNIQPHSYTSLSSDENVDPLSDNDDDDDDEDSHLASGTQPGVQNIEAVTVAWTARALVFAYIMIWLTYFVEGILSGTTGVLTPYVTSDFALHSLTPTVGILGSVFGGVTNLTLAKVLDVFGRPQGYFLCILLATVGLIMMTACSSVQAYAAAQVFQTVGNNGILYSLTVFVADTSSLRNRGLMQAIVSSPNLITCWLAGPISSGFINGPGWRWAFGMFAILVPSISLPLFNLLLNNYLKARKLGLVLKNDSESDRTALKSFLYYCREFDAVGLALLSIGVTLFLLPFNLYALQGWDSPLVVGMLIIGSILIIIFVVWERSFAPITFVPYSLLLDRTASGACILSATLFISFWCWNSFFSSYLQVVNGLSIESASYVVQVYTVCSVVCSIAVGALIHYTGRFKAVCLYIGIPLSILGTGLMMFFCRIESSIGYIIICQILISIAAGTIMVCDEVAILAAAASHQHVAVCLAVLAMFGNIGGAIGLTIASAIWQSVFPKSLMSYLPAEELPNLRNIYANLSTQLSYPIGSDTRLAIQHAYVDAQIRMLAVGTAVWVAGLLGVIMWRDINVIGIKQNKGHIW